MLLIYQGGCTRNADVVKVVDTTGFFRGGTAMWYRVLVQNYGTKLSNPFQYLPIVPFQMRLEP